MIFDLYIDGKNQQKESHPKYLKKMRVTTMAKPWVSLCHTVVSKNKNTP